MQLIYATFLFYLQIFKTQTLNLLNINLVLILLTQFMYQKYNIFYIFP